MELHRAIEIAAKLHGRTLDKGGEPYIRHPLRVMEAVATSRCVYDSWRATAMVVAVLHDVVEDTDATLLRIDPTWELDHRDLRAGQSLMGPILTASEGVALDALTRRPHPEETYREYIERVAADPIARAVKIADLHDNLSPARLAGLPKNERGIAKRYRQSLERLDV